MSKGVEHENRCGHLLLSYLCGVCRDAFAQAGAESIDAARYKWWLGLRDAEAETYTVPGRNFPQDEPT